jgi:thymidylate kinase
MTVALLGPDGVGKSSLAAAVVETFPDRSRVIYMGLYPVKGRFGHPQPIARFLYAWFRCAQAFALRARGKLVIFDRFAYDAAISGGLRLGRFKRFYRALLAHSCPAPDLTIVLDSPPDLLRARKPEHSVPELEVRRGQYLALAEKVPRAVVVSTAGDLEGARREVISLICSSDPVTSGR